MMFDRMPTQRRVGELDVNEHQRIIELASDIGDRHRADMATRLAQTIRDVAPSGKEWSDEDLAAVARIVASGLAKAVSMSHAMVGTIRQFELRR